MNLQLSASSDGKRKENHEINMHSDYVDIKHNLLTFWYKIKVDCY